MERRNFFAVLIGAMTAIVSSCANWMKPDPETGQPVIDPAVTKYLVNTAGFSIGGIVAMMPPAVDASLRQVYNLAVLGGLDTNALNDLIQEFIDSEDYYLRALANRMIGALDMLGAEVMDGFIVDISELDPELLHELGDGYVQGYDIAQAGNRKIVKG